ncbi:MAG: LD-carboxypeptidase [Lachnospiraceae bacterium]|nr:LD-carboxypeptidase [Lachnospiraceae bacterium]
MGNKIKDVTIVSLSRGILGESFIEHELKIGVKRLQEFGLTVHFSTHALKGLDYLEKHPESRANDLIEAFNSDTDMILCAVGGVDTYRLLPYLFENDKLKKCVKEKVFLGFSDATMNHLMLHKVGINTFYGQAFLPDVCELSNDMLKYSKVYFQELIKTGTISQIQPSDVWYDSRNDFSPEAIGTDMPKHKNDGFLLLQGRDHFEGEILGGCIDTIYDIFNNDRHGDSVELCAKYGLFPTLEEWKDKILLLESSESKAIPEKYCKMITALKDFGIFDVVSGVLIGKPDNEIFFEEYKLILKKVVNDENVPIVVNINVGHATPRCIVPFGVYATVDVPKQIITFDIE